MIRTVTTSFPDLVSSQSLSQKLP